VNIPGTGYYLQDTCKCKSYHVEHKNNFAKSLARNYCDHLMILNEEEKMSNIEVQAREQQMVFFLIVLRDDLHDMHIYENTGKSYRL